MNCQIYLYYFCQCSGSSFCITTYQKLARALYDGGVDGFLLETLNCWEEAFLALEGVRKMQEVSIYPIYAHNIYLNIVNLNNTLLSTNQ